MPKKLKPLFNLVVLIDVLLFILLLYSVFSLVIHPDNFLLLNSKGIVAQKERGFIVEAIVLMLVIIIPLLSTAYFFAWHYRAGNKKAHYQPEGDNGVRGALLWWALPVIIISALIYLIWSGAHELDPYKQLNSSGVKPMTIEVVALNWKWLFIYPEQGIATVNFVEFPDKTPVTFLLTADAPMNSFWIPQLGGQMYAMAGMVTQLHYMADESGEYNGREVEINGPGFSTMNFKAKSVNSSDFNSWVESVKKSQTALTIDNYNKLAEPSTENPVTYYSSFENGLYNGIIMKFMEPSSSSNPEAQGVPAEQNTTNSSTDQMMNMPGMHM